MADSPAIGTGYLRIAGDFSQVNAQAVGLFKSSDWSKLGKVAGAGLAAGLVAGGALKALYDIGSAFDEVSDKIRVRTGATGKELGKLEKSFRNVVKTVPTDFDSASEAVAGLNQRLDLTGKPLTRLSKQITQLSTVTGTDVSTNVQSVTRLFGDWSVKTKDQADTLDGLFRLTQKTGAEVGTLADSMVQFGAPLRNLGFDFDYVASMFASFEKTGVNTSTLLSGLRLSVANLAAPTDELGAKLKKLGIDAKDPEKAIAEVFEAIEKLDDRAGKTLGMEVFGRRAGSDMVDAVRTGRFELDELMKTFESGEETIGKAERSTRDFDEQWLLFKNNLMTQVEPVATRVFDVVGEQMKEITSIISDDNLDWGEKWDKLVDLAVDDLQVLVSKAGEIGPKIAGALVKGIIEAPMWAKLAAGAWLGGKIFGGGGGWGGLGRTIGTTWGTGFGAAAGPIAAGMIASALAGIKVGQELDIGQTSITGMFAEELDISLRKAQRLAEYMKAHPGLGAPEALAEMDQAARRSRLKWEDLWTEIAGTTRHGGNVTKREAREAFGSFADILDVNTMRGIDAFSQGVDKGIAKSKQLNKGISGNVYTLATAVRNGLQNIGDNTSKALAAFGVKEVAYDLAEVIGRGADAKMARGGLLPGYSTVDNIPAMLRSGEAVLTPEVHQPIVENALQSTYGMGLRDLFQRTGAKFASGGFAGLQPGIQRLASIMSNKFGMSVSSGLRPGDDGFHGRGMAVDLVGGDWHGAARYANTVGPQLAEGIYNPAIFGGPAVSWDSGSAVSPGFWGADTWAGHQDHIHAAISGTGGALNAAAIKARDIKRVLLEGPDSPLKRMGQAALDRVRDAANKFVDSQMPTMVDSEAGIVPKASSGPIADIARGMVTKAWDASQWPPFLRLKTGESGPTWDPTITNPSSGAGGIPQALPPSKMGAPAWPPTQGKVSSIAQIDWMNNYIRDVYGTPSSAYSTWLSRSPHWYAKGGFVGGASSYTPGLSTLLGQLGARKPKKRNKVLGQIIDLVRSIGLRPQTFERLNKLTNSAANAQSFASDAAGLDFFAFGGSNPWSLGKDDTPGNSLPWQLLQDGELLNAFATQAEAQQALESLVIPELGRFQGHTELQWLAGNGGPGALQELFDLRNVLVRADEQVEKRQAEIADMLDKAREAFRKVAAEVKELERRLKENEREQDKTVKAIDRSQEALSKEQDKPRKQRSAERIKSLQKQIDGDRQRLTGLRNNHTALVAARQRATGQREALNGSGGVIPTMVDKQGKLISLRGEILGNGGESFDGLTSVQGDVPVRGVLGALPALGTLGGEIFSVQKRLAELGVLPSITNTTPASDSDPASDSPTGPTGFNINELLEFVQAIRYGVFDNNLLGIPAHHGGGIVAPDAPAGTQEVLRRLLPGEGVVDRDTMSRGIDFGGGEYELTITNWDEGKGYIRRVSRAEIRQSDREASATMRAGMVAR